MVKEKLSKEYVRRLLARRSSIQITKGLWNMHFEDLARLMLPRRLGFVTQTSEGERRTEEIYDATSMQAARGLANAVGQLSRPEGEKLFFIRPEDDRLASSYEIQEWLKYCEDRQLKAMYNPKARFRQALGEADIDLVVFGTAVVFAGQSRKSRRLRYNTIDLKSIEISIDEENQPDTVFQSRKFTLRQAEMRFGKENLSEALNRKLNSKDDKNTEEKTEFLRVIMPRPNGKSDSIYSKNWPYTDIWIEVEAEEAVEVGGFREFPFAIPRWDTTSGEVYGRSPGMIALPDAETLNAMSETILVAGQKAADPPVFAPNDSSFDAINSFSGGITYYDVDTAVQLRGNPFFTIERGFNLPITRDMQSDTRAQVEAAFFKNIFNLPVKGPEMTATEVLIRKEEFIREMGPVFGRLESDYIAPIVERTFSILLRDGYFDPIPDAIKGKNIRFEYNSPINKVREQAQVAASRLWLQQLSELNAVKPEAFVMDRVDADVLAMFSARALDLPQGAVAGDDKVKETRATREKQNQDMMERNKVTQEAQIAASAGGAFKDVVQTLGGNNKTTT